MKTYFENDPDKQEMLECILGYINETNFKFYAINLIERITNESIDEVLRNE